jgi:hypothetical protein
LRTVVDLTVPLVVSKEVFTLLPSALVTTILESAEFDSVEMPSLSTFVVVRTTVFNGPADVTTVTLVFAVLGAVTDIDVDAVPVAVVVAVVVMELRSTFVTFVATAEERVVLASFFVTVVDLDVITPPTLERSMVVVTVLPSALVTSVELAPVTCLVSMPLLETTLTVVVVEFCAWASPRASTMRAALMKLMASNKY